MTEKLFREDPYLFQIKAKVKSVMGPEVVLESTNFYAFSGGQESDSGTIGGINVKEAVVSGNDMVYVLERAPKFSEGDEVDVVVDKEKRLKIMKLHSAAHIIYELFKEVAGDQKLIGSNVYSKKSRLDYAREEPITDLIPKLQERINAFLREPHEIKTYPDQKDPDKWLWQCEDWKMPCGGTHIKNTDEIGNLNVKRKNLGKGKERIEIFLEQN